MIDANMSQVLLIGKVENNMLQISWLDITTKFIKLYSQMAVL